MASPSKAPVAHADLTLTRDSGEQRTYRQGEPLDDEDRGHWYALGKAPPGTKETRILTPAPIEPVVKESEE